LSLARARASSRSTSTRSRTSPRTCTTPISAPPYALEHRQELATLQDGSRFKGLKRWLAADAGAVPQEQRGRLELLLGESRALQTAYAMRQELVSVWARSNASREHLLKALQDWCERAENSGVRQLQDLSLRLRSYVPS